MKKLIIILTLCFNINNSYAINEEQGMLLAISTGPILLPIGAFAAPIVFAFTIPKDMYEKKAKNRKTIKIIKNKQGKDGLRTYKVCDHLKELYVDADINDIKVGRDRKDQSNFEYSDHYGKLYSMHNMQYMCINSKKTKIYPNGCVDTIYNKKQVNGKWYLDKAFSYYNIDYVVLKKDNQAAFIDATSAIKYAMFDGEKVEIPTDQYDINLFNLEESIKQTCGNTN